jgi:phage baseplate assembly protein V
MLHTRRMDSYADLSRRLESLIRFGTIAAVQMEPPRVRMHSGALTSTWLPWLSFRAGTTRTWCPPTDGEQCVLLSPSGETTTGLVLVGLFSDHHPAPSSSPEEHLTVYPDGARVLYNHSTHALEVTGIATALVQAAEHVTVDCPKSTFTGDVDILGNLTVDGEALIKSLLTYLAGLSGKPGKAGRTVISGPIDHQGDFANTGTLSSNGVVLGTHKHLVLGSTTGEPQ